MNPFLLRQAISVAFLSGASLTALNFFTASVRAEPPVSLKELKEKRLALLMKIHKATEERRRVDPSAPFDEVRRAMADVIAARFDLAATAEERVKVCQDGVKYAEGWEKLVEDYVKGARGSPIDLLRARAYVLESRIALEKAKAPVTDKRSD
jgi:hypothetical protein